MSKSSSNKGSGSDDDDSSSEESFSLEQENTRERTKEIAKEIVEKAIKEVAKGINEAKRKEFKRAGKDAAKHLQKIVQQMTDRESQPDTEKTEKSGKSPFKSDGPKKLDHDGLTAFQGLLSEDTEDNESNQLDSFSVLCTSLLKSRRIFDERTDQHLKQWLRKYAKCGKLQIAFSSNIS
jgi:hypothetical protein